MVLSVGFFPISVHAGFFSFISGIFKDDAQAAAVIEPNSQKMKLLEAPMSVNPSIGGGEVVIEDEIALVSQEEFDDGNVTLPDNGQISVYVVRAGDTLSQIADMYDVSVNTLMWANNLSKSVISEGQTLIILPVSGVKHIVKSGDTIASIAKKYKADAEEIIQFNDLAGGVKLAVGTEIIVPDATVQAAPSSSSYSGSSTSSGSIANLPSIGGYYTKPIPGARRTQGIHGYNGVDLGAPIGTPIIAAASGKVIISKNSGYNGGYGNYVVIYHTNGTQTLYAHMNQTAVAQNTDVKQGQVIGYVGLTGKTTGPHLHFEIRGAKNPF